MASHLLPPITAVTSLQQMTQNLTLPVTTQTDDAEPKEGETGLLTDQQLAVAENVHIVVCYIAVLIALPLTVCNIVVFLHPAMRSATAAYVIGLSAGQLVYVTTFTLRDVVLRLTQDAVYDRVFWTYDLYVRAYGGLVARRGSYVVMCALSLERLYAIVWPLHVRTFVLARRPLLVLTSVYVITAVMHVFIVTRTEIRTVAHPLTGHVIYRPVRTRLYTRDKEVTDTVSVVVILLFTCVVLFLQLALNALTALCLRRHNLASRQVHAPGKEEEERRQRERAMTRTMLVTSCSYVLLSLPTTAHYVAAMLVPEYYSLHGKYSALFYILYMFVYDLTVFSCAVDFLCFVLLSSRYRQVFLAGLGFKTTHKESGSAFSDVTVESHTGMT